MALKKILDVDLDGITRFTEMFQRYSESLEKTRPAWAAVSGEAKISAQQFDRLSAALLAQTELARRMGQEQAASTRAVREQASLWDKMSHATSGVSNHIVSATKSLVQWAAVVTGVSAIFSAGGLYGIDRLAIAAGTGRRNALGLGLNYGENQAFGTDFGRVVDPQQFLGGVNEALHDVTKRWSLIAAGLTQQQMQGDTAQVGVALLDRLKQIADQTPEAMLAQVLQARGLSQFIGLQDFERLKHTSPSELRDYERQFDTDRNRLALSAAQLKQWQDLQVQLHRAGQSIETVLIRGLTDAAGPIGHLSKSFVDLLSSALGSGTFKKWIDEAADGVEWFAGYIGTPEFKNGVVNFIDGVDAFGHRIWDFVKWADGLLPNSTNSLPPSGQPPGGTWTGPGNHLYKRPDGTIVNPDTGAAYKETAPGVFEWQQDGKAKPAAPSAPDPVGPNGKPPWHLFTAPSGDQPAPPAQPPVAVPWWWPAPAGPGGRAPVPPGQQWLTWPWGQTGGDAPPAQNQSYRTLENSYNLPSGLLNAVSWTESRNNPNAVSPAGAKGQFQFTDPTARDYGLANPFDPQASAVAAAKYFRNLLHKFDGDVAEAAAAYNWGPGNVSKDIREHGADWRQHLPAETQQYVNRILKLMASTMRQQQTARPTVRVQNNTGGSAVISMAQLGAA